MAKWIVRIPFEGTGYIPLETDEDPKSPGFKQLVNNRVQIGNVHVNKPSVFKQDQVQVDPADDDEYAKLRRAIDEVNKREGVHMVKLSSVLDTIADRLESKGLMKEAAEIDVISNTLEAAEGDKPGAPDSVIHEIQRIQNKQKVSEFLKDLVRKAPERIEQLSGELLEYFKNVPPGVIGKAAGDKGNDKTIYDFFKKQYDDARKQNLQKELCYQNAFNMTAVAYHVSNADLNRILKENDFQTKDSK